MATRNKPVALITGASAGIGKEFARLYAADGFDLVIVARRKERLEALAADLEGSQDTQVQVIVADLADPQSPAEIFAQTEALGLAIDVLINNAGFGISADLSDSDPQATLDMIQVNCSALTALSHLYLPQMIARGSGDILNVGSTAGFQPGPGMSVYYATKAYVQLFSEGLREEVQDKGVNVSVLCPGATWTEFQDVSGNADSWLFSRGVMDVATVAQAGFDGLKNKEDVIVPGIKNKVGVFSIRLTPRPLARKVAGLLNKKK